MRKRLRKKKDKKATNLFKNEILHDLKWKPMTDATYRYDPVTKLPDYNIVKG